MFVRFTVKQYETRIAREHLEAMHGVLDAMQRVERAEYELAQAKAHLQLAQVRQDRLTSLKKMVS